MGKYGQIQSNQMKFFRTLSWQGFVRTCVSWAPLHKSIGPTESARNLVHWAPFLTSIELRVARRPSEYYYKFQEKFRTFSKSGRSTYKFEIYMLEWRLSKPWNNQILWKRSAIYVHCMPRFLCLCDLHDVALYRCDGWTRILSREGDTAL